MSGVRPMLASVGVRGPEPSTSPKNATPVISRTVGVMIAATPHPYCMPHTTVSTPLHGKLDMNTWQRK